MKDLLKRTPAKKALKETKNFVQKPVMPIYFATPTFTRGGFTEGHSEEVNVNLMSSGKYCVFLATNTGKRTAYTTFRNQEELEAKMNIQLL